MNRQYISDFFSLHSAPFFFPQNSHNGHFINLDISWLLHKMLPVTQHLQGRQTSLGTYWTTWGFLIKPQVLMQRWLPQVVKHRNLVETWLVKSTSTEPSLEHPEENKWWVGLLGKTLTPLKFQALGDGNMGKLFCRCRLGLEEDKKKRDALITQRKSPVSDGVSSEGEMLAETVQAGWSGLSFPQLSNLEQPNTL